MPLELLIGGLLLGTRAMLNNMHSLNEGQGGPQQPQYAPHPHQGGHHPYAAQKQMYAQPAANGQREVVIKAKGNHFWVNASIDGVFAQAMIDTGSSGVYISHAWARALGVDLRQGNYDTPINGGRNRGHRLTLPSITVEGFTAYEVDAIVPKKDDGHSLIGMSFLEQLDEYSFRGNTLIMRG